MPLRSIPTGLTIPDSRIMGNVTSPGFTNLLIDAASEKAAFIVRAPKTGTITGIGWKTGTVTTGATLDVRMETVSATNGDPSGSLWAADTNAAVVVADANDNTWFNTTFTASASVNKGDLFAIVIVNPDVSAGNINISRVNTTIGRIPYCDLFTSSWSKQTDVPCLALNYNGTYYPSESVYPISAITTNTWNNSSTPDVYALRFKLPFPARVDGCWVHMDLDGDTVIKLYDTDGVTVLAQTPTIDKDTHIGTDAGYYFLTFTGTATLKANKWYRLGNEPSSTTNLTMFDFSVSSAAIMDSFAGGQDFHLSTAKNPSAESSWTNVTTRRPFMGLILDQLHDGQVSDYISL